MPEPQIELAQHLGAMMQQTDQVGTTYRQATVVTAALGDGGPITVEVPSIDANGAPTTKQFKVSVVGNFPQVDDVVWIVYLGHGDWICLGSLAQPQAGAIQAYAFSDAISNGTATVMTQFADHNNMGTAPRDLLMVVQCTGHWGYSGTNNTEKNMRILDESGNVICAPGYLIWSGTVGNQRIPCALAGSKLYSKGEQFGYRLQYRNQGSPAGNVYIDLTTVVTLCPAWAS